MWWSRVLLVVMLAALGPAGCGFRPLYGHGDAGEPTISADLASVRVLGIADREGQQLRTGLVQRITPRGEPSSPLYTLEVTVRDNVEGLAESKDGNATVGRVQLQANYSLMDARTNQRLMSGSARSFASMRYLGPRYASVAAERDTKERALEDLAEDIRSGLAAWFAKRRANPPASQ